MVKEESQKPPAYQAAVFFVSNIAASKQFYNEVLGQKIVADFGRNVTFEGGLSIWEKNYALHTIFGEKAKETAVGASNVEIYFEASDINELLTKLTQNSVEVIHPVREHPWGQRAFRIYDPDKHIIEFAEPMSAVVLRLHNNGLSLAEIAEKSMMPPEFIKATLQSK
jgi:catechol 2,3-dioxygenase-like lactoylglutathione lyase family enzyme